MRRIGELPGVERVAVGTLVPWREGGNFGPGFQFSVEGYAKAMARTIRVRNSEPCRPGSSQRWACQSSPGEISATPIGATQSGS